MVPADIKWLHVELSSKCNAWCPACVRNKNGFGLADYLIEEDLNLEVYKNTLKKLHNLYAVQLCGNYGDPIASNNILDAIDISKKYVKKIQIHTNGGIRSKSWWKKLALLLKDIDHDVWFGIDGLAGIHEIYRQGTDFNKVISNAVEFINAGGYATWQFIPYAHNEHQIKDCLKESQRLGFKKFKLVKSLRDRTLAKNYRTGKEFLLAPPNRIQKIVFLQKKKDQVNPQSCMHLQQPSIYLSASGKLTFCCYHGHERLNEVDNLESLFSNSVNLNEACCLNNCG
jgi:MoaA/NifB/PqqE/SkfB family radical SAM enzyme